MSSWGFESFPLFVWQWIDLHVITVLMFLGERGSVDVPTLHVECSNLRIFVLRCVFYENFEISRLHQGLIENRATCKKLFKCNVNGTIGNDNRINIYKIIKSKHGYQSVPSKVQLKLQLIHPSISHRNYNWINHNSSLNTQGIVTLSLIEKPH